MPRIATRRAHLAAIHIAEKALGLSKESASALKLQVIGTASSADMNARQRAQYLAHLSGLQRKYGQNTRLDLDRPALKRSVSDGLDDRWHKARMLWHVLAEHGQVQADTDEALMAYVKRQTRMEHWRFCNGYQINAVIEALKFWCARVGVLE